MTSRRVRVQPDTYRDSVRLMAARRAMQEVDGVSFSAALMGTRANRSSLVEDGFAADGLEGGDANDLVLAVAATTEDAAEAALGAGEAALAGGGRASPELGDRPAPRTLEQATERLDGADLAMVSVPADYAVLEAHRALTAGLHVLLFSSGVSVEDEIDLKQRGRDRGLLVMGPDAGTAMLGGTGLGFANVVEPGPVGVVAAAGTGAQEVMVLLDRWGAGPSHVIGVGGRDPSAAVGGATIRPALDALERDPATEVLLLVSKPPAAEVAESILAQPRSKPLVATLLGLRSGQIDPPAGVRVVATLEQAALACLDVLGRDREDPAAGLADVAAAAGARLDDRRRALRGLFCGGTLCFETMALAREHLGPVHSNAPLDADHGLPAPDGAHVCLDLGSEDLTRGRPHPMIDPEPRLDHLREHADDPATAVLLVDVVLGHGSHGDPAGVLAPVCAEITGRDHAPVIVAHVLGSGADPQDLDAQRRRLADAGCLLAPTNARAALLAVAIAARRAELAEVPA